MKSFRAPALVALLGLAGWLLRADCAHAISVQLQSYATGFDQPIFLTHTPDISGRKFVIEREGIIRIIDVSGNVLPTPFLDISPTGMNIVQNFGSEQGLLGLAFHPNFVNNKFFYIFYTRLSDAACIVSRFRISTLDANLADTTSEAIILGPVFKPQENHNGGMIAFGPQSLLFISIGDGGACCDSGPGHSEPDGNGQTTDTLLGKILRLDVDAAFPYAIPPSNPFVSSGASTRKEIYALGFRNPWRFSFDRANGMLFCGDVGQDLVEEISIVTLGGNYGWRRMEGSSCYNPAIGCQTGNLILPIYEYTHGYGCSVTGGYVYRGPAFPSLHGLYFHGDFCNGAIRTTLETSPGVWNTTLQLIAPFNISSFGEDEAGELYVCDYANGTIWRIIDADPQPTPTPAPNAVKRWETYE